MGELRKAHWASSSLVRQEEVWVREYVQTKVMAGFALENASAWVAGVVARHGTVCGQ